MLSYAQNFEDVLLNRCFKHQDTGFYIDVGAWDPVFDSVTKHFYDKGWNGINIEPSPRQYKRLVELRPRDVNLQVAAGDSEGELLFYEVDDGRLSTLDKTHLQRFKDVHGFDVKQSKTRITTLANICREHVAGRALDFLKVDVEGWEFAVLQGNDWGAFRPRVVVIEATEPFSTIPAWSDWEGFLLSQNYHFAFFDGLNRYYVRDADLPLLDVLKTPANCSDDFILARAASLAEQLEEREHQLLQLHSQIDEEVRQRVQLEEEVATRRGQLVDLNGALERQTREIENCYQALYEDSRRIGWLSTQRQQLVTEVSEKQRGVDRLQQSVDHLQQNVDRLQHAIRLMENSRSWRLVRPVRALAFRARKLRGRRAGP
jgi:FkbM family methyltransferase